MYDTCDRPSGIIVIFKTALKQESSHLFPMHKATSTIRKFRDKAVMTHSLQHMRNILPETS